ncbi:MAG: nitroreductase [Coriobacteriales bacterium]|jgi:nitroreductase|nr:nitroreductase [Coriobacteriales bacterium]
MSPETMSPETMSSETISPETINLLQAIESRHSVRRFTEEPIVVEVASELVALVAECNATSGLHMQLMLDEPTAFSGLIGSATTRNARNYLALIGPDDATLDEKCGYYGEKVVLRAWQLGIGACWFGSPARKKALVVGPGEKLRLMVVMGNPAEEGRPHKSKALEQLCRVEGAGSASANEQPAPEWFLAGVRAAQLAPTAVNQQKFLFTLKGATVQATAPKGMFTLVDLGIVKYHFEVGAGVENFVWG